MAERTIVFMLITAWCGITHAQEKPPTEFTTPEAAFTAYSAAQGRKDWKTAWSCLTPQLQRLEACEALFGLGSHDPDYQTKYLKPDITPPAAPPATEEEQQKLMFSMLRDPFAVYAAGCEYKAKHLEPVDWKQPLRKLAVQDDRAQGVLTRYIHSVEKTPGQPEVKKQTPWDAPVHFQKTAKGRLLDAPAKK
jgi:hypothetical protein